MNTKIAKMELNHTNYKTILNYIAVIVIVLFNILLFFPASYTLIKDSGGPMGMRLLILPILIVFHLFLIFAIISLNKKHRDSLFFLIINGLAVILYGIYYVKFYL